MYRVRHDLSLLYRGLRLFEQAREPVAVVEADGMRLREQVQRFAGGGRIAMAALDLRHDRELAGELLPPEGDQILDVSEALRQRCSAPARAADRLVLGQVAQEIHRPRS